MPANLAEPKRAVPSAVYSCFDFLLDCDLPLGELDAAPTGDPRPLVRVRLGQVAETLPGGSPPFGGLAVAGEQALLTLPGVARFLMIGGREMVVDPHPGVPERTLRLFLLGSALGILCHQRGLLPIHANAVVAGGGTFAFAGPSGAGKSTLAAEFQRRGYRLLADDVCMVDFAEDDTPVVWPGIPRLKLWADAAGRFGHDCAALEQVVDDIAKFHVPAVRNGEVRPVPLRRLYLLSRTEGDGDGAIVRLRGHAAMAAVIAHTYRGMCLEPMGLSARHFRQCAELLSAIPVYSAPRRWGFDNFEREADRLEQHFFEEDCE